MAHPAKEKLYEFKTQLDPLIEEFFDRAEINAKTHSDFSYDLFTHVREIAKGGKRLRGALVYFAYKMFGGENDQEILKVASAIELIQLYILIADDFQDKADLRRGAPTISRLYKEYAEQYGISENDAQHFGNGIAVNTSFMICHSAITEMLNADFPKDQLFQALISLNDYINIVAIGQNHDLLNEIKPDVTEKDVIDVMRWKTAAYTYTNPLLVGAILAGASAKDLDMLKAYAEPAGTAFQIQDDILGVFGDEAKTGKSVSTDLKEGKQTLLIIEAMKHATEVQQEKINSGLGNWNLTKQEAKDIQTILIETGALEKAKKDAIGFVEKSLEALEHFQKEGIIEEDLEFLRGIADYMINRDL